MLEPQDLDRVFAALAHRLSAGVADMRAAFHLSFFTFNIEFLPATANAFTTGNFIVQNDSAFVLTKTMYTATLTDNQTPVTAVTVPAPATTFVVVGISAPFLVNLVDSGSGRQFSNIDTHIDNWFGSAERPFLWPSPQVLDPNSTFTMRVQNLNAATNFNVRAAFGGFKVFGNVRRFKASRRL